MAEIYQYLDYRKFLEDAFQEKKADNPHFSYRYIAQRLGLKSSGFFLWVLQGKRKLSEPLIPKVAELFKLNKKENEFFELLVRYNQAKTHNEKQFFFDRLSTFIKSKVKIVKADQHEFYEKWFYPVIHEIIDFARFRGDYKKLAKMVIPAITPGDAKKAVQVLEKNGFIRKNEEGVYEKADAIVRASDEWQSAVVHNLQHTFMDLGKEALEHTPRNKRDISNLTLSISEKTFLEIRDKLIKFRREVLEMAWNDTKADRVYQYNFQVFPVSKPMGEADT